MPRSWDTSEDGGWLPRRQRGSDDHGAYIHNIHGQDTSPDNGLFESASVSTLKRPMHVEMEDSSRMLYSRMLVDEVCLLGVAVGNHNQCAVVWYVAMFGKLRTPDRYKTG